MFTQAKVLIFVGLIAAIAILLALRSADKAKLETSEVKVGVVVAANKGFVEAETKNKVVAEAVEKSVKSAAKSKQETSVKVTEISKKVPENDFLNQNMRDDIVDAFNAGLPESGSSAGTGQGSN